MISFTKKEKEIIDLLLQAYPLKIIAGISACSINTIHTHLRNIHMKTQTHSIPEFMVWIRNNPEKMEKPDARKSPEISFPMRILNSN
jgi:DNA-binding CsgD family transcriptional regulator